MDALIDKLLLTPPSLYLSEDWTGYQVAWSGREPLPARHEQSILARFGDFYRLGLRTSRFT
jgi:hypothetical protein